MEFSFKDKTLNSQEIKDALADLDLGEINVQFSGDKNVLLRFKDVDEDTHQKILTALDSAISGEDNVDEEIGDESGNDSSEESIESDFDEEEIGYLSPRRSLSAEPACRTGRDSDEKAHNPLEFSAERLQRGRSGDILINKLFDSFTKKALAADDEVVNNTEETNEGGIEVTTSSGEEINIDAESIDLSNIESEEIGLDAMMGAGGENINIEEKRFNSIGPVIGNELKESAVWAIVIALVAIVLYIGFAFRKVSFPVSSFKYGIIATIALFHDVIITLGVFAVLGHFYNVEIGIPFVAAILAILGYSVNDTIVVFDRTRENLLKSGIDDFEKIVNKSVNETLIRSINTSFTTLIVLLVLYLFGGDTIKYFVVALMVGIAAGTYSSIFIASPLLVTWQKWDLKRKA